MVHQQGAGEREENLGCSWIGQTTASVCYLNWRHTVLDSQHSASANESQVASPDALFPRPPVECEGGKKTFKFSSCSLVGGARSLPDLISAFLLRVSPCLAQLKDQMSSSTNNFLHGLSDNCCHVQVTHCSCPKARYQVQLAVTLQLLCLRCPTEGRTCWNGMCVGSMNKGTAFFFFFKALNTRVFSCFETLDFGYKPFIKVEKKKSKKRTLCSLLELKGEV